MCVVAMGRVWVRVVLTFWPTGRGWVGGWVGGYEGKKRSLSWGPGKFFRLTVDRCNSSVNKCLVVAPLNAEPSWGHNFARQSRVCGICRALCVNLPIVLYRCRRLLTIFFFCWCTPHNCPDPGINKHQESTATIQKPPGINSNHPQPTSNIGQNFFPVPKPFKEQLSRRRVTPRVPPPPSAPMRVWGGGAARSTPPRCG